MTGIAGCSSVCAAAEVPGAPMTGIAGCSSVCAAAEVPGAPMTGVAGCSLVCAAAAEVPGAPVTAGAGCNFGNLSNAALQRKGQAVDESATMCEDIRSESGDRKGDDDDVAIFECLQADEALAHACGPCWDVRELAGMGLRHFQAAPSPPTGDDNGTGLHDVQHEQERRTCNAVAIERLPTCSPSPELPHKGHRPPERWKNRGHRHCHPCGTETVFLGLHVRDIPDRPNRLQCKHTAQHLKDQDHHDMKQAVRKEEEHCNEFSDERAQIDQQSQRYLRGDEALTMQAGLSCQAVWAATVRGKTQYVRLVHG
eukprot:CAMPEP_0117492734 /NCGR_PEP_ID=MMETSP0784-20121206/18738_1 /TAXON_ID=39447 /ORGANISM="" /LENGTH=310 /DNA_ID=CAMNT_0005287571 /DNA_START=263 /DNA_END=1193 /DNA_ORIENTATION=-